MEWNFLCIPTAVPHQFVLMLLCDVVSINGSGQTGHHGSLCQPKMVLVEALWCSTSHVVQHWKQPSWHRCLLQWDVHMVGAAILEGKFSQKQELLWPGHSHLWSGPGVALGCKADVLIGTDPAWAAWGHCGANPKAVELILKLILKSGQTQ